MLITADDYRYEIAEMNIGGTDYWFIVNQSGSIQSRTTEYKEDGDTLIDSSKVTFANTKDETNDSMAKGAVDASNTNVINAATYVYN